MNPTQLSEASQAEPASRWYKRFAIIGFILGAGFPLCYGASLIYPAWSQPELPPDVVRSGTPVLGAIALIAVCPLVGFVFGIIGAALGRICDVFVFRRFGHRP